MKAIGDLHVITDETLQNRYTHAELARQVARGGASVVQFREKRLWTTRELVAAAVSMRAALAGTGAALVVNDRADVAAAARAAGLHLGRHDLDPAVARRLLGTECLLGGTANSLEEAVRVGATDVDYLGVGPVFGTRSKADPAPALGLDGLRRIVAAVSKPVIAIGTLTAERVPDVMDTGVHGVAVLSAVVCDADPEAAARRFRAALDRWRREARLA
jgi:thiamine-phosphate pyrophosphorylase